LLTWFLAIGLPIVSVVIAVVRASIKYHSWLEAKRHIGNTLSEFVGTVILSSVIALVLLFAVFFVRDAPDQIAAATKAIDDLKSEDAKVVAELKAKYEDDIGQLNKKIVELQLRLDDREQRRRVHDEEVRLKNERIDTVTRLIATANVIAKSFEEKNDKDLVRDQYIEWERGALESLASTTFGTTYLAPFGSARGTGMSLMNHSIEGNSWYSLLEGKIAVLNGFLLELRKQ
jgi:hypothetical protein